MSTDTKDISARKVGVRFKPPALVIFYVKEGKLRKRVMPVRDLMAESDNGVQLAMSSMKEKHLPYLECVPDVHLIKLLRLLQGNSRGLSLPESLKLLEQDCSIDPEEDLNKVEDSVLKLKKETMNQTFEANRIKPGDSNFSYEVEVDFGDEGKMESGWDSDKDDFF